MGLLDSVLAQLGSNVDIANMAQKVGVSPEIAAMAVQALGQAHPQPGDTVQCAAQNSGISADVLQQIMGHLGGEGALGSIASMVAGAGGQAAGGAQQGAGGVMGAVTGMLDRDGDGNPINDIAGLAGGLFGKK